MAFQFRSPSQNWIKFPWLEFPLSSTLSLPAYLPFNRSLRISTLTWTRIRWKGCSNHTHLMQPFLPWPVLLFSPSHTPLLISSWSSRYWNCPLCCQSCLNWMAWNRLFLFMLNAAWSTRANLVSAHSQVLTCLRLHFSWRRSFNKGISVNAVNPTWSWKSLIPPR